jgi:UDP-N-acetylmuramoylalanine--D-glutamate ligase
MIPEAWRQGEVAVVGLGRSGVAASRWLAGQGITVYASDAAATGSLEDTAGFLRGLGVTVELGGHDLPRIERASAVIASPGVPPDAPPIVMARRAGVEVVAELDLGIRILDRSKVIAVTGTNGKTTTTALIAHVLGSAGVPVAAVGNIGEPLTALAADPKCPEWIALETSSFQLHDAPNLSPVIGVMTNLAPDHLDRYADVAAYYDDKRLLFRNAEDSSVWVLNADDPAVLELAQEARGERRYWSLEKPSDAWYDRGGERLAVGQTTLLPRSRLQLLGDHNVANALAAALASIATGLPSEAVAKGLETFTAPPHRLETVRTVAGVCWINDSKATNVSATAVALSAMTQPYVLVLGGRAKGERFDALSPGPHCRAIVAYGEAAEQIAAEIRAEERIEVVERFDDAVWRAGDLAVRGDVVLMSPACASFDQFGSFAERGDRFRQLVEGF